MSLRYVSVPESYFFSCAIVTLCVHLTRKLALISSMNGDFCWNYWPGRTSRCFGLSLASTLPCRNRRRRKSCCSPPPPPSPTSPWCGSIPWLQPCPLSTAWSWCILGKTDTVYFFWIIVSFVLLCVKRRRVAESPEREHWPLPEVAGGAGLCHLSAGHVIPPNRTILDVTITWRHLIGDFFAQKVISPFPRKAGIFTQSPHVLQNMSSKLTPHLLWEERIKIPSLEGMS